MASSFRVIYADFIDTDDAESLFTLTNIQVWTRRYMFAHFRSHCGRKNWRNFIHV